MQRELERLQLPEGSEVVAEPWPCVLNFIQRSYIIARGAKKFILTLCRLFTDGTDDEPQTERLFEVWMFLNSKETKHHPSANLYGAPLDFGKPTESFI